MLVTNFNKYSLDVRLVGVEDAPFIHSLRSNETLNRFINVSDSSVEDQERWISAYKERESKGLEYYFVFSRGSHPLGVERIYSITDTSFTFGSLVFDVNAPLGSAVLADIITKEFGFEDLGLKEALFDVRKANKSVLGYHKGYSPKMIAEDEENFYFSLSFENFEKNKTKYLQIFKQS